MKKGNVFSLLGMFSIGAIIPIAVYTDESWHYGITKRICSIKIDIIILNIHIMVH